MRRLGLGVIYLVAMVVALSPLFWVTIPALVDYPNHLARMWIIAHPDLATNYEVHWRLLPNLAMDLVAPLLAQIMPVELAGRVFIALCFILLVAGTAALRWALQGRIGLLPLLSFLFLYNSTLLWGFLNYLFALGVALLALAFWVATPRWRPGLRLLVGALLGLLLFVLHLFAFGIYGLLVAGYEFGLWWHGPRPRRLGALVARGLAGLQFVPVVLLWGLTLQPAAEAPMLFGPWDRKAYAWLAPLAWGLSPTRLALAMLVIGLVAFAFARWARALSLVPETRWAFAAILALAAIMPFQMHGSSYGDYRLPVALPFLLIAALRVTGVPGLYQGVFALVAASLFGIRISATTQLWVNTQRSYDEFRQASSVIAPGARIMAVERKMPADWRWAGTEGQDPPEPDTQIFNHLPLFAVIDRGAYIPSFFSTWTVVQPTARNGGAAPHDTPTPKPAALSAGAGPGCAEEQAYVCGWQGRFDYLVWIDYGRPPDPLPPNLAAVGKGSFFTIYRIVADQQGRGGSDG